MTILFLLTFIFLIFLIFKYFVYPNNINNDSLFLILLNIIFLSVIIIYSNSYKSIEYSLIFSLLQVVSAFFLNLEIFKYAKVLKIGPLIYYTFSSIILGNLISLFILK